MSLYLARVEVNSTGAVYYEFRDEEGLLALGESVAAGHGDDAVVSATELRPHEVDELEVLRMTDGRLYRIALAEISSRGG